ncbi:MAG: twin-arginine translocase TatA/TatE family subunit [Rhodospirillaceae bacterium]|nr:MAG: twin-arginine translocase TatA/TatE family subunit [Rhodospirillaceae bacterium]
MGGLSIWHWIIVILIALILFGGGGKISNIMGDFAKGIKAFKKGLKDEEVEPPAPTAQKTIDGASQTKDKDEATRV